MKTKLKNICDFVKDKISVSDIIADNYISTENIIPNKCGITSPSSVPTGIKVTAYRKNDVLVSNIRPYFRKIWFAENDGGCSNDILVFRAKSGIATDFLYYILSDDRFFDYATKISTGTKMPRGDKKAIMEYIVSVPDYETQKKSGYLLRLLDRKIELNNKINKNLEQQAQIIFDEIIYSNNCMSYRIEDLLVLLKDGTHNPPKRMENGVPLITGQTLENGFISYDKMTYISQENYEKIHKKYQPQSQDLIITKIGTVGKVAILRECDIPIAVHCNSAILRFDSEIISQFWGFWLLKSEHFKKEFNIRIANTIQNFVSLGQIAEIPVLLPTKNIIKTYEPIFKSILEKMSLLNFENQRLSALRDVLIPKLIDGETDVSKIQI